MDRGVGWATALLIGWALLAAGAGCRFPDGAGENPPARDDPVARAVEAGLRRPTAKEIFFSAVALDLAASDLCDRVHPEAFDVVSFSASGEELVLARSECFRKLAIRLGRPELCDRVVLPAVTYAAAGTYSAAGCLRAVEEGRSWRRDGWLPAADDFIAIMQSLGYDAETIVPPGGNAEKAYAGFYTDVVHGNDASRREEFLERVRRVGLPAP